MPVSRLRRVSQKQILEWVENPVTLALRGKVAGELQKIMDRPAGECLVYGKPNETHEALVRLEASAHAWSDIYLAIGGDWDYFEELDDE